MYSAKPDFEAEIGSVELDKLTKPKSEETLTSAEILEKAIQKADELIDTYISSVTSVPIPDAKIPKLITGYSVIISIYGLHARIQYEDIPEFWKDKYKDVINHLKDISAGKANLIIKDDEGNIEPNESGIEYCVNPRIFGRGSM